MQGTVASGISHPFRQLSQSEGQITHVLLTRSPLEYPPKEAFPLDLHVLSTPPAFVLSQDQTLHRKPKTFPTKNQSKPKNDQLANNRQNHHSSTQKNPNTQPQQNQDQMNGVHTNQFIDKHTVEFSKIRRAPEEPRSRRLGGNLIKLTGPSPWASNRIRLVSAARLPTRRRAARGDEKEQ
jgi:hypothetical protein